MLGAGVARGWLYPVAVWLVILAVIFLAEYALMLLLPWLLPEDSSRLLESVVDAVVLTLVLAPLLWWTLVRPSREVIRLRTQFLADLFAQIECDRQQTARELHDGVGQSLTLLISGLRSAKSCKIVDECASRVAGFQRLAEDALTETKRLSLGLRPSLLDDLGLAPALERLVEDTGAHHPVAIALDVAGLAGVKLEDALATAVFRIVQEGLANVVKHAKAKKASVTVRQAGDKILVEVADDGCGIEPGKLRAPMPGHLGLRGMSERAALLEGELSIESTPGRGTRIHVAIPAEGT